MTIALVFAMSGGAYAANKYLITSTKQISPKVLKSLKGASGKNGAAGPAGPAGATGSAGTAGPQGTAGLKGENGAPGTNGKNGTNGVTGFTETLPSGKTEKGTWSFGVAKGGLTLVPVSFTIPLAKALGATEVHYVRVGEKASTECPGTVANPEAEPNNLCVYEFFTSGFNEPAKNEEGVVQIFAPGEDPPLLEGHIESHNATGTNGALVLFFPRTEEYFGWGSWAVTAP
jgi:hypothetical protein